MKVRAASVSAVRIGDLAPDVIWAYAPPAQCRGQTGLCTDHPTMSVAYFAGTCLDQLWPGNVATTIILRFDEETREIQTGDSQLNASVEATVTDGPLASLPTKRVVTHR